MMWCFRILLFMAVLFTGSALGRMMATSEVLGAIYLTTTVTVYDGTATPTDSIEPSTLSSAMQSIGPSPPHPPANVPPAALIPLPLRSKDGYVASSRISTFITKTIPLATIAEQTLATTSTSSAAEAIKQPNTSPNKAPKHVIKLSGGAWAGIFFGAFVAILILIFLFAKWNDGRLNPAKRGWLRKYWKRRKEDAQKRAEKSQGSSAPSQATPVELEGESVHSEGPSAPQNVVLRSHHSGSKHATEESEGGSTVSRHNTSSTCHQAQILPVELPAPADTGDSALPRYEDLDTDGGFRQFSWAAPEAAYRPEKFESRDMI
ncbi:hypothetical protein V8C42DRAFT_317726 [Trichoderma barbatum]